MTTLLFGSLAVTAAAALLATWLRRRRALSRPRMRGLGRSGLPVAIIARRTGLSQDAVRAALAHETTGGQSGGSFFREWTLPVSQPAPAGAIPTRYERIG